MRTGIGPTNPASHVNEPGKSEMDSPPLSRSVRPLAMASIARVAMKEGMRTRVTRSPFTAPHASPMATPARVANGVGHLHHWSAMPPTTPESASTDPTERSMPPVSITKVSPAVTAARTETWARRFLRFVSVRKWGERAEESAESPSRTVPRCAPSRR